MLRRLVAAGIDLSTLLGIGVLVTGGFRTRRHPVLGDINLTYFGPFFLPLVVCLVLGLRPTGSKVLPLVERLASWFDALPERAQRYWVLGTITAALLAHGLVVCLRYYSFQTAMDLAIYSNACRGALYSTMKGDVWLFADHFEPLLILFTPLCRAFSPAMSLLVVQTIGWGIGAFGVYMLARQQRYRASLAWFCAALYLCFNGHVTIAYYDFHLLSLTLALIPWLWWALASERYGWLVALAITYVGLKESVPLSLAGLGAFLVLRGGQEKRRIGLWFVVGGLVTFAVIMKVIYPAFRGGEGTMYFAKYYGHLGNDFSEFVSTFVTRPGYFIAELLRGPKLYYFAALLAPFLFFPLFRPIYLLPILPAVLVNILSNDPMAVIAFASSRFRALWLSVMLVVFTAPSALGVARWTVPTKAQRRLSEQLATHVPHDRAIAAPQRIAAHLTDREKLYMFDYWQMEEDWKRADLVVIGYHGASLGWYSWSTLHDEKLPKMLPHLRQVYEVLKHERSAQR
jgi:hypothetical protein